MSGNPEQLADTICLDLILLDYANYLFCRDAQELSSLSRTQHGVILLLNGSSRQGTSYLLSDYAAEFGM